MVYNDGVDERDEIKLHGSKVNRGTRMEIGCNMKIQITCFKHVILNDITRP